MTGLVTATIYLVVFRYAETTSDSCSHNVWEDDLRSILIVMVEVIQCSDVTLPLEGRRHACTDAVLSHRVGQVKAVDLKAAIDFSLFQCAFLSGFRHLLGYVTLRFEMR